MVYVVQMHCLRKCTCLGFSTFRTTVFGRTGDGDIWMNACLQYCDRTTSWLTAWTADQVFYGHHQPAFLNHGTCPGICTVRGVIPWVTVVGAWEFAGVGKFELVISRTLYVPTHNSVLIWVLR